MQRVGFPHDDELVVAVSKAFDATHALNVRLHYLGVASGVGSPPRGDRRGTPVK